MISKSFATTRILTLASSVSLLTGVNLQAAFENLPSPTFETPGVVLDPAATTGFGGTVLAVSDSAFVDNAVPNAFATGTLRSFVVDRGSGLLDFYYQLANTTARNPLVDPADQEFYRLKTSGGFDPSLVVSVAQTTGLSGLIAGAGSGFSAASYTVGATLKSAATADRDVGTLGSVGFDFPIQPPLPFIGDPNNVAAGQSSSFLVVRTNSKVYGLASTAVSGAATSFPVAFAAVPEPSSVLFGLAILATGLGRRVSTSRRRK